MFALLCSLKGPEGALVLGAQLTGWEQRRGPEATPGPFCRGPRKATGGRGDVLGGWGLQSLSPGFGRDLHTGAEQRREALRLTAQPPSLCASWWPAAMARCT